ncbi:uncharacterized protein I206_101878 [Kwoniella pini CBS 10737]|uniref:GDP/GTP exchange factor Sec2 N-terminal domain-containing protein n=1 Tax=Kwoniella pini CBS 10737 TaxID=1296096 RepID=A0A1B9HVF9_9TREE|nr:uncharacterized protein I206_07031 [Kwoniella pini CBS 10737]OCF47253.1 hypothetical protein I206_07031 [Kwoniella pini CBS 10737]
MSEQNQVTDKVDEQIDEALGSESSQTNAGGEAETIQPIKADEDEPNINTGGSDEKAEEGDELVEKDIRKKREKPSPIILPKDLLESQEVDKLHEPESPTTSLINSLRSQLTLISDQSILLNQKLISSISKSADLEDELNELINENKKLNLKTNELKKEKENWEESMKTGLLVERSQIKDEMQKLAQGLVEEERKRGNAEEKRREVENEVDDLTAKLFDQANAMVATERMSRVEAESRLKLTEENLAAAESAVRDMQLHLQNAHQSSSSNLNGSSSQKSTEITTITITRKYLSSHLPYTEFIGFITHLRSLRPLKETSKNTFPPPLITNLLTQPFLNRSIAEDNDPTLRLDVAPDLSWLSRRSVSQAILSGDLIIEPVSTSTFLNNSSLAIQDIGCSLCGKSIFPHHVPQSPGGSQFGPPPAHPQRGISSTGSRFSLKPFFNSTSTTSSSSSTPVPTSIPNVPSPSHSPAASPAIGSGGNVSSVYVFRIAKSQIQTGSSTEKGDSKLYPLCRTGWCLERMRATCEFWHFVRTGIIHVVWHGDDGIQSKENNRLSGSSGPANETTTIEQPIPITGVKNDEPPTPTQSTLVNTEESKVRPPPLPQRKKSSWALGFKLSDKSTGSWTRGWKSGSGPTSPGSGPERRESVGSLGAEKGDNASNGGLGLGEAIDIDEKKSFIEVEGESEEKDVPVIQEPLSLDEPEERKQNELGEDQEQRPGLSRAGSNISIPLSTNTDETGFHTPKGGQNDLPSEDGHEQGSSEEEEIKRDEQATPHPPLPIDTTSRKEDEDSESTVKLNSPSSATDSPTKAPPPIPRRAAARNRLSQLSANGSGANSPIIDSPNNSTPPTPVKEKAGGEDAEEGDDLSILRELRDELDQRKAEDEQDDENGIQVVEQEKNDISIKDVNESKDNDIIPTEQENESKTVSETRGQEEEEEEEQPFTPINLDEKFPLSPLQQQVFPINPSSSSSSSSRPNSQPPPLPPALPPRHPKTPTLQSNSNSNSNTIIDGKRYFNIKSKIDDLDNQWEEKTWEKIVKLKEEMFKARIGVIDE